jgi:hypothetical protein
MQRAGWLHRASTAESSPKAGPLLKLGTSLPFHPAKRKAEQKRVREMYMLMFCRGQESHHGARHATGAEAGEVRGIPHLAR